MVQSHDHSAHPVCCCWPVSGHAPASPACHACVLILRDSPVTYTCCRSSCMYIIYVCMYICMYVIYVYMYMCVYVYMYVCNICVYLYMYTYVYMYVCIYVCM